MKKKKSEKRDCLNTLKTQPTTLEPKFGRLRRQRGSWHEDSPMSPVAPVYYSGPRQFMKGYNNSISIYKLFISPGVHSQGRKEKTIFGKASLLFGFGLFMLFILAFLIYLLHVHAVA